ncbi:sugar (and other) transporter family protein [Burkholderia ambifaria AMMD]|uniref:Major facilitator superfamily MFS_1 n=1 Tax=Burkholderia ambifaria (strain ATCC BAA-244 / DSM 16087 / CCUG 44356 / LMG 19182 / AMMD) TaxID=339670 RepID=Q0B1K7_BURCM|nr:MFS transporter [Burkholderia ambifaria]ABI91966.1 major facilitator superfamily MFS_1 [Burkholderia ambifaria AMMD]AJY25941.1 sugar (and other) transporter family protein [Burkholderia ambifaria AMMD]MBR7932608.1 MFS transporter [Burkholderia ambifaria]PEH70198.1 MFS transporter [Burkholderia ambifaria]QQC08633.1 MFS transporter [Burkholderia ambifaria]
MHNELTAARRSAFSADERRVVFAASLGAVFEWYDFFLYGSLAALIAAQFFSSLNHTTAFVFALLTFAAGFIVRPIGALVFGRLGDLVGRKHTFLLTILIMGCSTLLVGLLPGYATLGVAAPIILVVLRMLQGLALGGEYGAAATYVAEHAPHDKRGGWTSWIQTTSTIGLLLSLVLIITVRSLTGTSFEVWGWRIPFLFSGVLLGISVYVRLSMHESPAFQRIKAEGRTSRAPLSEAFGQWRYLKLVLQALFGLLAGQAVVWFTALFYAMFFLTQTLKVDAGTTNLLVGLALVISTPLYVFFGRLSDRIGRKPIILCGSFLAALTIVPIFHGLTHFANPALAAAQASSPVAIVSDPADCSFQFNPTGTASFNSACDVARRVLSANSASYATVDAAAGSSTRVKIGATEIAAPSLKGLAPAQAKVAEQQFRVATIRALGEAGYPLKANPETVNRPMILVLLVLLMAYGAMTLGPIAAILVEMFPTRIRYTAMSLPYHVGNGYFGGLLPTVCFALVAQTGDIYFGLWYPVTVAAVSFVIGLVFIREPRRDALYSDD